jgi:hypothetical protein
LESWSVEEKANMKAEWKNFFRQHAKFGMDHALFNKTPTGSKAPAALVKERLMYVWRQEAAGCGGGSGGGDGDQPPTPHQRQQVTQLAVSRSTAFEMLAMVETRANKLRNKLHGKVVRLPFPMETPASKVAHDQLMKQVIQRRSDSFRLAQMLHMTYVGEVNLFFIIDTLALYVPYILCVLFTLCFFCRTRSLSTALIAWSG